MDETQNSEGTASVDHGEQTTNNGKDVDPAVIQAVRDAIRDHGVNSLTIDDLTNSDLPAITWSGSATHMESVAGKLAKVASGSVEYLVARAPSGQPIAKACIDYSEHPGAGTLTQLATLSELQGYGIGTRIIEAAEARIRQHGQHMAIMGVEDSNPRARALYERLGYKPTGREKVSWTETNEKGEPYLFETEVVVLSKDL